MELISIGDAAKRLGQKYHWVHRWVRAHGLGQKVGWGIVLKEDDLVILRGCGKQGQAEDGSQKAA